MRGLAELGNPDVAWVVAAARQRLGDEAYNQAHARGQAIDDVDAAIDALRAAPETHGIPAEP
jgi:hypothetical protein